MHHLLDRRLHLVLLQAALLALVGCPSQPTVDDDDDDSAGDDDDDDTSVVGCITLDGYGDYATIQEAIDAASEGSVVSICEGEYQEALTITVPLTIQGHPEEPLPTLTAPTNQHVLTFSEAMGAGPSTVQRMNLTGTRNGITATGGSGLIVQDVAIASVGGWGLNLSFAGDVQISNVSIDQAGFGGIQVADTTNATITDLSLSNITSWGINIDDATASVTNLTVDTVQRPAEAEGNEGCAINGSNLRGRLSVTNADIRNVALVGILTVDGATQVLDSTFDNLGYAVYSATNNPGGETIDWQRNTITNVAAFGLYSNYPGVVADNVVESFYNPGLPATEWECGDGLDGDGDGQADCADADCVGNGFCNETICYDSEDNDGDGLIDCEDTDCSGNFACGGTEICNDTIDNDGDGLIDCEDDSCIGGLGCAEDCDDLIDNDGDAAPDCADPDCASHVACGDDIRYTLGVAVIAQSGDVTVTGNTVRNDWGQGISINTADSGGDIAGSALVEDNIVEGGTLYGLEMRTVGEATVRRNEVSGTRWNHVGAEINNGFGTLFAAVDTLILEDHLSSGHEAVGLALFDVNDATLARVELSANEWYAGYIARSTVAATDLGLSDNAIYGLTLDAAAATIDGITVADQVQGVAPNQAGGPNPFQQGGWGVFAQTGSVVEIGPAPDGTRSSFTRCAADAVYMTGASVSVTDADFLDNPAGHLELRDFSGTVGAPPSFSGNTFTGDTGFTSVWVSELAGTFENNSFTGGDRAFYVSSETDGLVLNNNTFSTLEDSAIQAFDSRLELTGNQFTDIAGSAVRIDVDSPIDWSGDQLLSGNVFQGIGGDDVYLNLLYGGGAQLSDNQFLMADGEELDSLARLRVLSAPAGTVSLTGDQFVGGAEWAIVAAETILTLAPSETAPLSISGTGAGVQLDGVQAGIDGITISDTTVGGGIVATDGTLELANSSITGAATDALSVGGVLSGLVLDNVLSSSLGWGLTCTGPDVSLDPCQNAMADNALGDLQELDGCVLSCSLLP